MKQKFIQDLTKIHEGLSKLTISRDNVTELKAVSLMLRRKIERQEEPFKMAFIVEHDNIIKDLQHRLLALETWEGAH